MSFLARQNAVDSWISFQSNRVKVFERDHVCSVYSWVEFFFIRSTIVSSPIANAYYLFCLLKDADNVVALWATYNFFCKSLCGVFYELLQRVTGRGHVTREWFRCLTKLRNGSSRRHKTQSYVRSNSRVCLFNKPIG